MKIPEAYSYHHLQQNAQKKHLDGCSPISVYINVSIKCMQQRRSHMVGAVAAVVG